MRNLLGPPVKLALREHYVDLALMEDALRDSDLYWTIVRPPRLTNGPLTGVYRTAYGRNVRGRTRVSRAYVAHHLGVAHHSLELHAAQKMQAPMQLRARHKEVGSGQGDREVGPRPDARALGARSWVGWAMPRGPCRSGVAP